MCFKTQPFRLTTELILLFITLCFVPSIYGRCGCQKAHHGQGFFAHGRGPSSSAFEPLSSQPIQDDSDGGSNMQYSVPNFRVLMFQPTFLDFHEQPVGMPSVQSIILSNPSDTNDIEITAIHVLPPFHASKFGKKVLSPLMNMTVEMVFLASMLGNVEHTVYIYTSRGNFPYQVFGVGRSNPYRLRSFVFARMPVNATFSPYINIYNPYSETMQIQEMYSSGNDLHLDLLGNNESLSKLWEIPPYETKAIMKATYFSKEEGFSVRFIRIVVGPPAPTSEIVILPLELHVSNKPGIYTNVDMLDFGTLRTMDEPKSLNLNIVNYGNKSLQILSIQVIPPNKAVSIQFTPLVMKAAKKYTRIATVTFSAYLATQRRMNSGKLIVNTGDEKKHLEIHYHANVLHGTLAYSVGKTSFFVGNSPSTQVLTITNTFNHTLVIYNATLPVEARNIFSILGFNGLILVPSGKLISPLSIKFTKPDTSDTYSTVLRLYTNASIFTIPVHSYTGKLQYRVESVNEDVLDYGTVGMHENRSLTFTVVNRNPVEVSIKEYGTKFEYARLQLLHIRSMKKRRSLKLLQKENATLSNNTTKNTTTNELVLKPSDVATFVLDVTANKKEGTYHGLVYMKTIYETIKIPIYAKTVKGSLIAKPQKIHIENSFPGRTENYPISIESTFDYAIQLKSVDVYPLDTRFKLLQPDLLPQLPPKERTHIGWLKFDPLFMEDPQCYVCICDQEPACEQWHHSISLPANTWEMDFHLLEKLKKKWDNYESSQDINFNASIVFDSTVIKSYTVPVQVSLAWPSFVQQSVKFPTTHVGNYSIREMFLTNPSDHPLLVQVIPLLSYPQPEGGLDLLSDRFIMDSFSLDLNGHSNFYIPAIREQEQDHKNIQAALGVYPSSESLTLMLEPRQRKAVQIGFTPVDEKIRTSILVVRSNLTILDVVVVQGTGAYTYFNINGHPPGLKNSVLHYEIKPVHLEDCNKSTPKARVYPSFTVKKSFTAANTGQLPLHVSAMNINGYECEGYGFRVLNCEPFHLLPNTSKQIDITFSPDFSTSRVTRTLQLLTPMGESLDYSLLATLPHHLLPICADALPRPFWEPYLHVVATVVMSTVFIFIIFFAYFDAQKYVVQCTFTASRGATTLEKNLDLYTPGTVFDLNAIAGVKVRISDKKEKCVNDCKVHQRLSKTSSCPVSKSNQSIFKRSDSSPLTPRDQNKNFSDSSSSSSRKNSNSLLPPSYILEQKPEPKIETQTKRVKRRPHEPNRNNLKTDVLTPVDPVIVTEEIRDPWERDLMEKVRLDRQKLKNKYENSEDSQKNRKRSKPGSYKKELHRPLQKENSSGSNKSDDENILDNFTTVEGKTKIKKKVESPMYVNSSGTTLDKLDEISLSGPRPDGKEMHRKASKSEQKSSKPIVSTRKKILHQHEKERLAMDTPTSPHAIAAAIVEAALVKSQQKKKTKGKGERASNAPSSPLSEGSRSNSYNSILNELSKEKVRCGTPSGILNEKGFQILHDDPTSMMGSSPKKMKKKETGWGSYFRKFGLGFRDDSSSPDDKASSMFYYDNLSSLRASKKPTYENHFPGFPQNNDVSIASNLSPDSAEFVPASQRINKVIGSNLKKESLWSEDSDKLRPPPGLSRPVATSIWGNDDILPSPRETKKERGWANEKIFDYAMEGSYSSLLGSNRSKFGFDLLTTPEDSSVWERNENEFEKELWQSGSQSARSSIWDAPPPPTTTSWDAPPPPTTTSGSSLSRLGLGLDLKPVSEIRRDADSPLDPFSIWGSSVDPVSPYEGWNHDIKEN